jgi:hypothetical protein
VTVVGVLGPVEAGVVALVAVAVPVAVAVVVALPPGVAVAVTAPSSRKIIEGLEHQLNLLSALVEGVGVAEALPPKGLEQALSSRHITTRPIVRKRPACFPGRTLALPGFVVSSADRCTTWNKEIGLLMKKTPVGRRRPSLFTGLIIFPPIRAAEMMVGF